MENKIMDKETKAIVASNLAAAVFNAKAIMQQDQDAPIALRLFFESQEIVTIYNQILEQLDNPSGTD